MTTPPAPYHGAITLKALLENPDLLNPPTELENSEKKGDGLGITSNKSSAYLAGNLWDNTVPLSLDDITNDLKFEFMDIDEFLLENEVPLNPDDLVPAESPLGSPAKPSTPHLSPQPKMVFPPSPSQMLSVNVGSPSLQIPSPLNSPVMPSTIMSSPTPALSPTKLLSEGSRSPPLAVEYKVDETDVVLATIPGEDDFDPRRRQFSDQELKPQPIMKKSRKIFVPEDLKDDRYWCRRKKNNVAAKRSRDARRIKENQIALRASFLEKENSVLRLELEKMKSENKSLKSRLTKYEG